jgi:hypothetical protein
LVISLKLDAGPFQKAVVIEELQSPQQLQGTAAGKGDDLVGTQKPMPVDQPENAAVAASQLHRCNGGAFEAGQPFVHPVSMMDAILSGEAGKPAIYGKILPCHREMICQR